MHTQNNTKDMKTFFTCTVNNFNGQTLFPETLYISSRHVIFRNREIMPLRKLSDISPNSAHNYNETVFIMNTINFALAFYNLFSCDGLIYFVTPKTATKYRTTLKLTWIIALNMIRLI